MHRMELVLLAGFIGMVITRVSLQSVLPIMYVITQAMTVTKLATIFFRTTIRVSE
jgi:hypothetical protein